MQPINKSSVSQAAQPLQPADSLPVAVIDIGSTSARLVVAQPTAGGHIEMLDFLQQAVGIGHDTFTTGTIKRSTISECVDILNQFNGVMREYGITDSGRLRAIATSAVREAGNRDAFLDRIYIGCGITIQVIEEIDVARFTYLSFYDQLQIHRFLGEGDVLLVEMGGGSTDILHLQNGDVSFSSNFGLGSFRLREMISRSNALTEQRNRVIDLHIRQAIEQIKQSITTNESLKIIIIGSDARFAARHFRPDWEQKGFVRIPQRRLNDLSLDMLQTGVDELALQFKIRFVEAETIGPALRMYSLLAKSLNTKNVLVTHVSMRSGVLIEMMQRHLWVDRFRGQVLKPALEVGRRYNMDKRHVRQVARFAGMLFDELQQDHKLTPWHRLLLNVAALLHDIGSYVSARSHHKHSMYLIRSSELFGLTKKDITIVAMVARYHRRSAPKPTHEGYHEVTNEDRLVIIKLAALLRVADALDKTHTQHIDNILFERFPDEFVIIAPGVVDVTIENMALQEKGSMFEDVYGMRVRIRTGKR